MRARRPTSEEEERQPAIATRVVEFLEQKKAAYLAKQQHTKKQRHAYDQQKSKTPARKKVLARARKKFQRRHSSKILRDQKKRRHTIKLRRVRARRNPDPPRILLAGTDSVVTLDELKHPRFIVDSPRHGRSTERLPYADPQSRRVDTIPARMSAELVSKPRRHRRVWRTFDPYIWKSPHVVTKPAVA
jgi:hypothetical protein